MAIRDPKATRQRIVDAARLVFAEHGLAGARVDMIAAAAHTSKERLYANFRTKEEIFQLVLGTSVEQWLNAVPFTVNDLPGYAVALFGHFSKNEIDARLILWGQLASRSSSGLFQEAQELLASRAAEVVEAQKLGVIDADWDAFDLFGMIYGVAMSWIINPNEPTPAFVEASEQKRRSEIVRATVAKLVRP